MSKGIQMICWEFLVQSRWQYEMRVKSEVGTSSQKEDLEIFSATEVIPAALQRRDWKIGEEGGD